MRYLALLLLAGCGGIATVPGDTYTKMVENDGMPTWVRRTDGVARCEYFYNSGRWLEVDYDLTDWTGWIIARKIAAEHPGKAAPVEPTAIRVRYDVGAAWRSLSRD